MTERNATRDATSICSDDTAVGIYALSNSKIVSIVEQPQYGIVMLAFTDEADPLALNSQTYHVPAKLFRKAVEKWLASQPKD